MRTGWILVLATACNIGDDPHEGPEEPALPSATLCADDETVVFSCALAETDIVSLCKTGHAMGIYRGLPDAIEGRFEGPFARTDDAVVYSEGKFTFTLNESGLTVRRGDNIISERPCQGNVTNHLAESVGTVDAALFAQDVWSGAWSDGNNSITFTKQDDGTTRVTGDATWMGRGDVIHTGELDGILQGAGPQRTHRSGIDDGCEVSFSLETKDTMTVGDNKKCGGMNVTFDGSYQRKS
ncbi:MAG: hypothetical protein AAFV53_07295 [Myxococcota bacterium]